MPLFSLFIINKAGSLSYQISFPASTHAKLSSNDYLVLASTFQSVHALTTQIVPDGALLAPAATQHQHYQTAATPRAFNTSGVSGVNSGIELLESDHFKLYCYQTLTGIKIVLTADVAFPQMEQASRRIYEVYADYVAKNPFHNPDMPIRSELFDANLNKAVKVWL